MNKQRKQQKINGGKGEEKVGRQQKKYALKWFSSMVNDMASKSF